MLVDEGCKEYVTSHTGCVSRNVVADMVVTPVKAVTSHTGCVSRNFLLSLVENKRQSVTSHTGCVSRNASNSLMHLVFIVTSHTGCVSRNKNYSGVFSVSKSHPTRDVWVEILLPATSFIYWYSSHPTRDVWVEMYNTLDDVLSNLFVTSHTGCVSRNKLFLH